MAVRSISWASLLVSMSCACLSQAGAQGRLFSARGPLGEAHEVDDEDLEVESGATPRVGQRAAPKPEPVHVANVRLPSGRDIATLTPEDCMDMLDRAAVAFQPVPEDEAPQVASPVFVNAPLYGVSFGPKSGDGEHGMLDCRLALALYAWAPILAEAGVEKVEHYSTYRPGARVRGHGKPSGHAHALAIDAARFHLVDGRVLDVDLDWEERERGGDPCPVREDEGRDGQLLRRVVCAAVERDLFQVVLTPHYDRAHQNHVHLELVPDVDWSYVR